MRRLGRCKEIKGVSVAGVPKMGRQVCKWLSETEREARFRYTLRNASNIEHRYNVVDNAIPHFRRTLEYHTLDQFHQDDV